MLDVQLCLERKGNRGHEGKVGMFGGTGHLKLKRERKISLVCLVPPVAKSLPIREERKHRKREDELCIFGGRGRKKVASINPLPEGSCFLRALPSELMTKKSSLTQTIMLREPTHL